MKSVEIQAEIERLEEKAHQAEQLEQLYGLATQAKEIIYDVLDKMSDLKELGFVEEDYETKWNGTLESIINTIVKNVESKLEAL